MALLPAARASATTDSKAVVATISGPYVDLVVETGLAATTPTYSLTDSDDPYDISGDGNSDHYRYLELDGVGASYLSIRHLWTGTAVRTCTTDPVVRVFCVYPNLNKGLRASGVTRDVDFEYSVAYDRANSNAFAITIPSDAANTAFVSSTDFISASRDVLVDVTGAQKVILAVQTLPIYSGNVSASRIQGRWISFS